jgi:opacity protein-like surface antigen
MKNIRLAFLALSLFIGFTSGAQAFEKGKSTVSASIGYSAFSGGAFFKKFEKLEDFEYKRTPPLAFAYEYAITEKVGIGLNVGYSSTNVSWINSDSLFNYQFTRNKLTVKARMNYHFIEHDKFDPYFGIALGYKSSSWDLKTNDNKFNEIPSIIVPISMDIRLGARYFFIPQFGAYAEFGIGHGLANIGLVGKF